ncbi:unnamed protein product, partial [Soboliphyme baturini]|uniref:Bestrophin homolog n=1 Tax=Soboliphyme baturini TaxID=241478 RepID=A0A183I9M9_9BILA
MPAKNNCHRYLVFLPYRSVGTVAADATTESIRQHIAATMKVVALVYFLMVNGLSEHCDPMYSRVIRCINERLFNNDVDEVRYEAEMDRDFRLHSEYCFR